MIRPHNPVLELRSLAPSNEELARRLKELEEIASPLLTVSLSEDRKKVLWKIRRSGIVRMIDPVDVLWA